MILVEVTVNTTVYRVSDEQCHLTHQWDNMVKRFQAPNYTCREVTGGYVEAASGSVIFNPYMFVNEFFPPKSCPISISLTDTTEEAATLLFEGTAHREQVSRDGVVYSLHGTEYTSVLAERTYIDDTLTAVFSDYCGAGHLNLDYDDDNAAAVPPAMYRVFEAGTPIIDMLSELAAAACHLYYIKAGTLYLVDATGATPYVDLGELVYRPRYTDLPPYKQFSSEGARRYTVSGYGYGLEEYSGVALSIEHIYGRIGDNDGDDEVILIHDRLIPYEAGKHYMMIVKARKIVGAGTFHAGFAGVATDRSTWVNTTGANAYTGQHTFVAASVSLGSAWTIKRGYASGWAATGDNTEHPDVGDPAVMHTNVAYVRPFLRCHYSAQAGKTDLDFIGVYEVDATGKILEELFYDDFTTYGTARHYTWARSSIDSVALVRGIYNNPVFHAHWIRFLGSGNRETISSVNESLTNVEAALTRRRALLQMPRVEVSFDLTAANVPNPGDRLRFSDYMVSPDGAAEVQATVLAHHISIDTDENKFVVEGPATIDQVPT